MALDTYLVRRVFTASGTERLPGEVVDTSTWPYGRARALAEQRYIEPLPHGAPEPLVCDCGRRWRDEDALVLHLETGCGTSTTAIGTEPVVNTDALVGAGDALPSTKR